MRGKLFSNKYFFCSLCLFAIFTVFSPSLWGSASCEKTLQEGSLKSSWQKVLEQVDRFAPELIQPMKVPGQVTPFERDRVIAAYLAIKQEAWIYAPHGLIPWRERPLIPPDRQTLIYRSFQGQFDLDSMSEEDFYQFHLNLLKQSFQNILRLWIQYEIAFVSDQFSLLGRDQVMLRAWLTRRSMNLNLHLLSLHPDSAAEYLLRPEWRNPEWNPEPILNQTTESLQGVGLRTCCASEPGCRSCPNNRAFRIKGGTSPVDPRGDQGALQNRTPSNPCDCFFW